LGREYYVRQLRDMKWSPDPSGFVPAGLSSYAELCGHVLARAHARTGDAIAISAYLGGSGAFDEAIRAFALRYADQVSSDYAAFTAAVASGRLAGGEVVSDAARFQEIMRNPMAAHAALGSQATP
jgi:hypothetical protein